MKELFLTKFNQVISESDQYAQIVDYLPLLIHSLILGFLLSIASYYTGKQMLKKDSNNYQKKKAQLLLASTNIFYLCFGLSSIMILVNNNIARAFSIGAAISLVRFRRKLGEKNNDSNILFGIIAGMACGLGVIDLAWIISAVYIISSLFLAYFTNNIIKELEK